MSARVLVVDDERPVRFTIAEVLRDAGFEVVEAADGQEASAHLDDVDVVLTDLRMPELDGFGLLDAVRRRDVALPVVLLTARGSERDAVTAMKRGAYDYLTKPFDADELAATVARAAETFALRQGQRRADAERRLGTPVLGRSATLRALIDQVVRVAPRSFPVLVTGETGTGKELVAGLLHSASPRAEGPLVRFNCAAVPLEVAESELFGHVRGAFTGALRDHRGYFARADGGTLVMDEVAEMPAALQAKVLRAVQEGEVQPVGATRTQRVDVRVVACTHRDLRAEVEAKRFREDLFYRLAVVELCVPPLRERPEDIPLLARAFANGLAREMGHEQSVLDERLIAALVAQPWPGNVRELQNVIARMMALSADGRLGLEALALLDGAGASPSLGSLGSLGLRAQLGAFERGLLERTLAECGGNQSEAARRLGVSRTTLLDKLARHGLR